MRNYEKMRMKVWFLPPQFGTMTNRESPLGLRSARVLMPIHKPEKIQRLQKCVLCVNCVCKNTKIGRHQHTGPHYNDYTEAQSILSITTLFFKCPESRTKIPCRAAKMTFKENKSKGSGQRVEPNSILSR